MVSMTIAQTTAEERKMLREAGFVHVTGLTANNRNTGDRYVVGETLKVTELGRWDWNNDKVTVVTMGGEVWLGGIVESKGETSPERAESTNHRRYDDIFEKLCPRGKGAYVPCSNGETIGMSALLQRLADPDWSSHR